MSTSKTNKAVVSDSPNIADILKNRVKEAFDLFDRDGKEIIVKE